MNEIINRVANSPLVSLDLEEFHTKGERVSFDLSDFLYQGLVVKEKEFRNSLKEMDWANFKGKYVAVFCSTDAIVPTWAYMLAVTYLHQVAKETVVGDMDDLEKFLFQKALADLDMEIYRDKPVVVKGCSKVKVPLYAYGQVTNLLMGVARSIMYGEPCSTVPLYKRPKQ
ncbi:DUF2480 family protein [Pleomorphovibrio marinus]|uniref:DUF2480 family protein n=1 Tax=Pleomorphovibrio marinus TaxID=2164132 RepID=UPI000E0B8837|nr:DUF2480 family protein [Pleomorphovibrio marinus]